MIHFVEKFFGISAYEAAIKLANDFEIPIESEKNIFQKHCNVFEKRTEELEAIEKLWEGSEKIWSRESRGLASGVERTGTTAK